MTPRQPSEVPPSLLIFPTYKSDSTCLQNVAPPGPISASPSPSRKTSGLFFLRNATTYPTFAPNPPLRKTSSTSTLIPLPSPLGMFKRQDRKTSFDAVLRHPSVQSLKARLLRNAVAEPPTRGLETSYESLDRHVAHKESDIESNSTMLLPMPQSCEDEGYSSEAQSLTDSKKRHARSLSSEDEGYNSDHGHNIDLKHPTRIERRILSSNVPIKYSIPSSCTLCQTELKGTLETYAFPKTAPAVITTIRNLYPALDTNRNNRYLTYGTRSTTLGKSCSTAAQASMPPTFCLTCFEELHALQICWTCGLTVHREEERVGYGWAWWHWGCMSCLLCRAPVRPPAWTAASITLSDSPACKSCLRELRELVFIETRKQSLCRRGFSPPWIPQGDLGVAYSPSRNVGTGVGRHDGSICPPSGSCDLGRSGIVVNSFDSGSSIQQHKNSRMTWMMRKGEGGVGGRGNSIGSRRGSSTFNRFGAITYPPLPKWMEQLPGRRSVSGGIVKV